MHQKEKLIKCDALKRAPADGHLIAAPGHSFPQVWLEEPVATDYEQVSQSKALDAESPLVFVRSFLVVQAVHPVDDLAHPCSNRLDQIEVDFVGFFLKTLFDSAFSNSMNA